jgi:hypothetical protein
MCSNTARKLTHQKQKSNFFTVPNSNIARSGLLEKIKYEQWHIFPAMRKLTKNINVINLASLLAAFPRMGIYSYEISQNVIAEKMGELFEIPVPARNTISKWERELSRLGFLEIPKHVDWKRSKTKIRVLTREFWDMSRKGLEPLSYTCPHVTFLTGKVETVTQVIPNPDPTVNFVTKIHAHETKRPSPPHHPRVDPVLKKSDSRKYQRPPRNGTTQPKKLNRFENSISHWLFQNRNVSSYREAVILFSLFLRIVAKDEFCQQLKKNWIDCTDASRPGMVTGLINYLRNYIPESNPPSSPSPVPVTSPTVEEKQPECTPETDNPDRHSLRLCFFFGAECIGKYAAVGRYYKNADHDEQQEMVSRFCDGEWP